MLIGFVIVAAFAAGMWLMKEITIDYEDRIISAVKGREYSKRIVMPEQKPQQRQPQKAQQRPQQKQPKPQQQRPVQAKPEKPMLDEDDYDKLMREGKVVKRR